MFGVTGGKYYFYDELVSGYNYAKLQKFRKEKISFVFQNFALMNCYSVYENVEMTLLIRKVKNKKKIIMDGYSASKFLGRSYIEIMSVLCYIFSA